MDARLVCGICLLATSVFLDSIKGSAIDLASNENSIKPVVTQDLTLRCSLRDTASVSGGIIGRRKRDNLDSHPHSSDSHSYIPDSPDSSSQHPDSYIVPDGSQALTPRRESVTNSSEDVDFVIEMMIYKNNQEIASMTEHVPARAVVSDPAFSVTGSLTSQPGERGFLQLTWPHPTGSDEGVYRCEVEAVTLSGKSFSFATSLKVDEAEVTFEEVVQEMLKMKTEKDKMADQLQENEKEKQQMNATINSLVSHVNSLQQNNNALTSKLNKLDTHVFFSAGLTTTGEHGHHYTAGTVVVFDKVFSNIGSGYDHSTGIFTCPQSGYYKFDVIVRNDPDKDAAVKILHNNYDVLDIDIYKADFATQGGNSVILDLQTGDTIRVVAWGSITYLYSVAYSVLCTFSGYLIDAS